MIPDGAFYPSLQRLRRRRASVTGARQPYVDDSVLQPHELDPPTIHLDIRTHIVVDDRQYSLNGFLMLGHVDLSWFCWFRDP
jgi:hypothetical protein